MLNGSEQVVLSPQQIGALLSGGAEADVNRRNKDRRGFSMAMLFAPLGATGKPSREEALRVTGKDISETGIGFVHHCALPSKRGVVYFEHLKVGKFAIEVVVLWTVMNSAGVFESGCRMLRKATDHKPAIS